MRKTQNLRFCTLWRNQGNYWSRCEQVIHAKRWDRSHFHRKNYWIVGQVPPNNLPRRLVVLDLRAPNQPLSEVGEIAGMLTVLDHRWTMNIVWRRSRGGPLTDETLIKAVRWARKFRRDGTLKVYLVVLGVSLLFKYSPLPTKGGEKVWTRDVHQTWAAGTNESYVPPCCYPTGLSTSLALFSRWPWDGAYIPYGMYPWGLSENSQECLLPPLPLETSSWSALCSYSHLLFGNRNIFATFGSKVLHARLLSQVDMKCVDHPGS